jgi:hypothetical protein
MQVLEFAKANAKFSIHDIKAALRSKVANQELEIPETEVCGTSYKFEVTHVAVKTLFLDLLRTNGFGAEYVFSRKFNGMYFEYTPSPVNVVNDNNAPTIPVPQAPAQPSVSNPTSTIADPMIQNRIATYLSHCKSRNFRPSLKQVQSAIKRSDSGTGISCDEIQTYVKSLNYNVISDPDALSRSQVEL